jgi:hypothetical protein
MNPTHSRPLPIRRRMTVLLLAASALLFSLPLHAADGGRKLLKLEVTKDRRSAEVTVPKGYGKVVLMRFDRDHGWRKVATRDVDAGVEKFKLPASTAKTRWRAVGVFKAEPVKRKFPASFYNGRKTFDANASRAGNGAGLLYERTDSQAPALDMSGDEPVEADIWKVDGNTVFFFNQLRGLQVLDVANPADPRLLASMRLPAVGEDLYLLPGSGSARDLVLVTRHESADGESATRVRVVRYEAGALTVRNRMDVRGYAADSRMTGDRLILATTEWGYAGADDDKVGYESRSRISQWTIRAGGDPLAGPAFDLPGSDPVIAAGTDWLAAAVTPPNRWNRSDVTVFALGKSGLTRMNGLPFRTAGAVRDKFKMQWRDHVLTTISESIGDESSWVPVTVLQNFRVWGPGVIVPAVVTDPRLGSLELARGESLFATRFAGDKAYIVTFLQTDPLWVVDLRDAAKPVVSGHIEVPGWSTYLQPIGDLLFSVGWESDTIAASLFDVSDPAAPSLLRRENLGPPGSYSEAAWDEQALKLLPEAGLALIPVAHHDAASGGMKSMVQLLDVDIPNKKLTSRGAINHAFDARRSELVNGAVVSISQRALVTADINDRDHPVILSEVALAWPVDRILDGGSHLIHIENGNDWSLGRATARVTPANDPEAVLAEIDLGKGVVNDVALKDGKLHVIRDSGSFGSFARVSVIGGGKTTNKLFLDVYDATSLPALVRLGGCSAEMDSGYEISAAGLLWPQSRRPAVLLQPLSYFWFNWGITLIAEPGGVVDNSLLKAVAVSRSSMILVDPASGKNPPRVPRALAFDVSDPTAPVASSQVDVGSADTRLNGVAYAADGMIVAGSTDNGNIIFRSLTPGQGLAHSMHVIEVGETGAPVVRPAIDLPGDLFAVTELDRDGFLAWTSRWDGTEGGTLAVSASDGHDASEVASLASENIWAVTAHRRRLFTVEGASVKRRDLNDRGGFDQAPALRFQQGVHSLRVRRGVLIGVAWDSVSAVGLAESTVKTWRIPTWSIQADGIRVARDGDLLVPLGEYGAVSLER